MDAQALLEKSSLQSSFRERSERPSLDNSSHKWPRKRRRLFQRSMSGLEYAAARGERARFLTLTSSPSSSKPIHDSFRSFVKRVRRRYGSFEYLAVKEFTKSGLAHLHILFRGPFLDQAWVSSTWQEIHGAKIVYIEEVRGNLKQVANYLAKYIISDGERFWWSWNWVYRGFVRDWNWVRKNHTKEGVFDVKGAVDAWRRWLWKRSLAGAQARLEGG
jgi:hypothetical protein